MTAKRTNIPTGHWSTKLIKSLSDPTLKVFEDDLVTAITDVYPKSTYHYLVCPKEDIRTLADVTPAHLSLLQHMSKIGEALAEKHKDRTFRIGYHAVPSMLRLHLHVISDDFNSPCLKNKKHWNSFNTDFFIPSDKLIKQLERGEKIGLASKSKEDLLKTELKCHKCDYKPKNMPDLKSHIILHVKL